MIIWTYCFAIILVLASVESKNGDIDKKKIEHGKGKSRVSVQTNRIIHSSSLLQCVSELMKEELLAPSSKIKDKNNVKKKEEKNKGKGKKKILKKGKKKNLKKGKGKKDPAKNRKKEGDKKKQRKNKSINQGKDGKTKKSGKSHVKSEENLEKYLYRKPKSMEVFVES